MVRLGSPTQDFHDELSAAQAAARTTGLGIWDPEHRTTKLPTDYRHGH